MSKNRISLGKNTPSKLNLSNPNNNTNTLAPISADELSTGDAFFRSGQQSPKPRGRKKVAMPTPNKATGNIANAGTPGTTSRLLDNKVGRGSRLTPLQTGNVQNNTNVNNTSPSRGQRSPLRRHLVRANNSFNADTDLVAKPPGRTQVLDKIVQNTTVDPTNAGRRAYRLATQLPTTPNQQNNLDNNNTPKTVTPGKSKAQQLQNTTPMGQRRKVKTPSTLVPTSPSSVNNEIASTSPTHAKRAIIEPDKEALPKLCVVLDLDETLVHSIFHNGQDTLYRQAENRKLARGGRVPSFNLKLADGDAVTVNKRPKLAEFLKAMETEFHAQVFTAALSCYAEPVLNRLDPKRTIFKRRLYREGCTPTGTGAFAKDLNLHFKDLSRVVLVDNNPVSLMRQPDNGLLVPSFFDDPQDDVLPTVLDFLRQLSKEKDIRPVIRKMRENSA